MPMLPGCRASLMIAVLMPIDLAAEVQQRTAGVARVDRRVGLQHLRERALGDRERTLDAR